MHDHAAIHGQARVIVQPRCLEIKHCIILVRSRYTLAVSRCRKRNMNGSFAHKADSSMWASNGDRDSRWTSPLGSNVKMDLAELTAMSAMVQILSTRHLIASLCLVLETLSDGCIMGRPCHASLDASSKAPIPAASPRAHPGGPLNRRRQAPSYLARIS